VRLRHSFSGSVVPLSGIQLQLPVAASKYGWKPRGHVVYFKHFVYGSMSGSQVQFLVSG
jgi:hypothetical protein